MPEFDFTPAEDLREWILALPTLALEVAQPAMTESVTYLHGQIPAYPEAPSGRLMLADGVSFLHTAQQRKWFFRAVKKNELNGWEWQDGHPQKTGSARTGTLGRRFTEAVRTEQQSVVGQIGTNLGYAPWVVGPDYPGELINGEMMHQARAHVDRWWQFGDVIEDNLDAAWEVFTDTFWPQFLALAKQRLAEQTTGE